MQQEIWPKIVVIPTHAQDGNLFRGQNVAEHCRYFEDKLEIEIQGIPHNTILSLDKETLVTRIASRYISADITNHPTLKLDEANLSAESSAAKVEILYRIPFTGNATFFTFEPASKSPDPSSKVTINLDISIPRSSSRPQKASLVNWLPWSVLKISGCPLLKASFRAAIQKSRVLESLTTR